LIGIGISTARLALGSARRGHSLSRRPEDKRTLWSEAWSPADTEVRRQNVSLISWLLQTLVTSGIAIIGFVALTSTRVGERWLSHRFERQLAELRAELARHEDRGRRANEREFDAVSAIWDAFVDAFLKTNQAVISYLEFPDLDQLSQEDLAAFLESTELSPEQRQQVTVASKKSDMYSKIMNLRRINTAGASIFDARLLVRRKGIFVQRGMVDEFKSAIDMLSKAQVERLMEFRHRTSSGFEHTSRLFDEGNAMFDRLQSMVRTRLVGELTSVGA
jgi:hypothetical protein